MQYFCPGKPNSVWSKINKEKVIQLAKEGLITQAGLQSIKTAKLNGSWIILDDVEKLKIHQRKCAYPFTEPETCNTT